MRNHCCSVDPSATNCAGMDCTKPNTGKCVPMLDCSYGENYFNEFSKRCELKEFCPAFWHWDERSRKCETYNHCD